MESERKAAVLLVDDQPNNLLALEAILGGMGLDLVRARSGEEALMRVLDADFAVILMDVQMPGLDGFETAAMIRERERSQHTPVIFLTAFQSDEGQVFQGYKLGAVDFLSKPVVPTMLRSKVGVFVDLFQKAEQVKRQAAQLHESQRREHARELVEEKRRWELERFRDEAARERKAAEAMTQRAEELSRIVAERTRAEEQLRDRASQQAVVADLGQQALSGLSVPALMGEALARAAGNLKVKFGVVKELAPDGGSLRVRASLGLEAAGEAAYTVGVGTASLAGFTLGSGEPVVVKDLEAESRFAVAPVLRERGVRCALCVIIQARDRPFGTLAVLDDRPRGFSPDDVNFLQAVANVLAAALQRHGDEQDLAAIRDELAVQLADMTRLHALGARLSNSLELPRVLGEVLAAVTELQGTGRGVLMLKDRGRETMTTAASVGFTPEEIGGDDDETADGPPPGETLAAVISGGLIIADARTEPVLVPHAAAALRAGCHAACSTPLLTSGGVLIGAIATYFPRLHRPSDRETRLVELYARQAAEFIDNARLYREIREADRHKDEFLAMLAHELRNPLAPLTNALHMLRQDCLDPGEAAQVREIAERQVRHLARLVDDLLDVSRINTGKIQLQKTRVDLVTAVSRAVDSARPLIEARRHELSISTPDEPVPVEADPSRLEQVLSNLLNNAAKYTEPGGRIDLRAGRDGGLAFVSIRDTGIGIAPELLPRVFDLFTQEERSLDRSQGGLGIGLTLVRRLVELHGGTVVADSAGMGRGSEFVIRLPLAPPAEGAGEGQGPREEAAGPGNGAPKRVLVVDDNKDGAVLLARLLRSCGHQTTLAHDGPTALGEAIANPPDVVILDIGLPGMDGFEVARRLRELDVPNRPLLVALTGYGREDDVRRSLDAGFDHHMVKPADPKSLSDLLARHHP